MARKPALSEITPSPIFLPYITGLFIPLKVISIKAKSSNRICLFNSTYNSYDSFWTFIKIGL